MQSSDMVRSHEPCHGTAVPGPTHGVQLPPIGPSVGHPTRLSGGAAGAQVEGSFTHGFFRPMPNAEGLAVGGRSYQRKRIVLNRLIPWAQGVRVRSCVIVQCPRQIRIRQGSICRTQPWSLTQGACMGYQRINDRHGNTRWIRCYDLGARIGFVGKAPQGW